GSRQRCTEDRCGSSLQSKQCRENSEASLFYLILTVLCMIQGSRQRCTEDRVHDRGARRTGVGVVYRANSAEKTDSGFTTEVHHVTGDGEDAGVVYCEMQGRENTGESRVYLQLLRTIYPGCCGYKSETGGIMKNLRESVDNQKVRAYHKAFYRPENLTLIITGQVKPEDLFKTLEPFEQKIASKGPRGAFQRPWQDPVPPLTESSDIEIKFPCDEEDNGMVYVGWRGPSAVTDLYKLAACSVLMKYLTDTSVSPLPKEFVEVSDPYCSKTNVDSERNRLHVDKDTTDVVKATIFMEPPVNVLQSYGDSDGEDP
ncbi:hypothetical protein J6590_101739, partial [Homalodisca vitripennis]